MRAPRPAQANVGGTEGPTAEFVSLREEIQERFRAQQTLLSLQLTLAGTVFGFAISQPGMTALLLIVPFSSYLLCGRLVAQHFAGQKVAQYITEVLSGRVQGGLGWEQWLRNWQRRPHLLGSTFPLFLTFVGSSALALAWTAGFAFRGGGDAAGMRYGMIALWLLGLAATSLSATLVLQMAGRLPTGSWERASLS